MPPPPSSEIKRVVRFYTVFLYTKKMTRLRGHAVIKLVFCTGEEGKRAGEIPQQEENMNKSFRRKTLKKKSVRKKKNKLVSLLKHKTGS